MLKKQLGWVPRRGGAGLKCLRSPWLCSGNPYDLVVDFLLKYTYKCDYLEAKEVEGGATKYRTGCKCFCNGCMSDIITDRSSGLECILMVSNLEVFIFLAFLWIICLHLWLAFVHKRNIHTS